MKNLNMVAVGGLVIVAIGLSYFLKLVKPEAASCVSDECLMVDGLNYPAGNLPENVKLALNKAIIDEYKAHTAYEQVIKKIGMVRPFSMIIRAEETHIASLKSLFDKYGIVIPTNDWVNKIEVASTLKENCQIGVEAEIENARLYKEELLPLVTDYPDVTGVFTNLMNASEQKHLTAFNRCN